MTQAEFANARRRYQRHISAAIVLLVLLMCLFLAGAHSPYNHIFRITRSVSLLLVFSSLAGFVVATWIVARLLHKKHHLICPSCGSWLLTMGGGDFVMRTGQCRRCQSEMFHVT